MNSLSITDVINIPLSVIYQAKTIASLARIIIAPDIYRQPFSPLITMQPKDSKTPLFFIHPVGGTVFCYIPLVKYLSKQRPFYALQDPRINDKSLTFSKLEEVASFYINKIKEIQSKGPYLLGGASYGGTVAFEMARQLQKNGEEVKFVALLDSWAVFSDIFHDKSFFKETMHRQHKALKSQLSMNISTPHESWLDLQWKSMQLLLKYKLRRVNIKLTLFKSKNLLPQHKNFEDFKNHWQKYTDSSIDSYIVPGDHESILYEPNVQVLAQKLQECLDKLD